MRRLAGDIFSDDRCKKKRCLRQQPLRRTGILQDDRFGKLSKPCLIFRRQILARIDDDRKILEAKFFLQPFEQLKSGHIGQTEIDHHAVEVMRTQFGQSFLPRGHGYSLHITITDQINDRLAINLVIFDDKQSFTFRSRNSLVSLKLRTTSSSEFPFRRNENAPKLNAR